MCWTLTRSQAPPATYPPCPREAHGATLHHWRWRGLLTDYLAAEGAPAGSTKPAILLTHGFGAFSGEAAGGWPRGWPRGLVPGWYTTLD